VVHKYVFCPGSFVQKIIQICVHGSSFNNGAAVWQGAQLRQRFLQKGESCKFKNVQKEGEFINEGTQALHQKER
jgi:hypothetical protein